METETNFFGTNNEITIPQKCPVCGKVHEEKYVLKGYEIDDYNRVEDKSKIYKQLVCENCKDKKEAFRYCYTCGKAVKIKNDISGIALLEDGGCELCEGRVLVNFDEVKDAIDVLAEANTRFIKITGENGIVPDMNKILNDITLTINLYEFLDKERDYMSRTLLNHYKEIGYDKVTNK